VRAGPGSCEPIACAGKRDYTARQNLSARHYAQNQNFRHKRQVFKETHEGRSLPGLPLFGAEAAWLDYGGLQTHGIMQIWRLPKLPLSLSCRLQTWDFGFGQG
jgi:hypothetical protein